MNNLFIKKLILENFQKHSHLELDFTNGFNIVTGETDIGKSCIVRALTWIYFNEPTGNCIRKAGTKKTSVKIWLNTGYIIERLKSDTANAYIINENDKNRYDSIGKVIPEDVKKVLGIYPFEVDDEEIILNIANQITMPFLLDKAGTFRNKLFNKLTGADLLDNAMQGLNSDLLHINKEERIEQNNLEENKTILEEMEHELKLKQDIAKKLTEQFNLIKTANEQSIRLNDYKEKIDRIELDIFNNQKRMESIKLIDEDTITDLDYNIHKLETLNELLYNIKENKKYLLELEELNNKIKIPEINTNDLRNKIEQLNKLQKIIKEINNINSISDNLIATGDNLNKQIEQDSIKYKELLTESGICSMCKRKITKECIDNIKL